MRNAWLDARLGGMRITLPAQILAEWWRGPGFADESYGGRDETVHRPYGFIECKPVGTELADHDGQLSRYFNATPTVRVAIITDGVQLRAFTDLRTANVMDSQPWFSSDLRSLKPAEIDALRRFRKADFAIEEIVGLAEEMVYYNAMVELLSRQLREPSEGFVRFVAGEIQAAGRVTGRIVERLTPILRKAIQSTIVEHVARSFEARPAPSEPAPVPAPTAEPTPLADGEPKTREGIVTTAEEREIVDRVVGWIREVEPEAKIVFRDSKSYFAMHQDNVRKWFLRGSADRMPWSLSLRHVSPDEARRLAPGVDVSESGFEGGCRFSLPTIADIGKVRAAIILAYQREGQRSSEDASTEPVEA